MKRKIQISRAIRGGDVRVPATSKSKLSKIDKNQQLSLLLIDFQSVNSQICITANTKTADIEGRLYGIFLHNMDCHFVKVAIGSRKITIG